MIDQKTLDRISRLHPIVREEVKKIYLEQIVPALTGSVFCRFAYTLRTFAEQDELYSYGRTKLFDNKGNRLGKVTYAKGGQSVHNFGLALDIVLIDGNAASWNVSKDFDGDGEADWMEIVRIFKENDWEWGGDWEFEDKPHFQKTFGYSVEEFLEKHNQKDYIPGTTYINI